MRRPVDVLLVEDSPTDRLLAQEALSSTAPAAQIFTAEDGEQAMDFIHRRGRFETAPRPDLVLLDLNLPRKDGREILRTMRETPELQCIPIIVLTGSNSEDDLRLTQKYSGTCLIRKSADAGSFRRALSKASDFWVNTVTFPPEKTIAPLRLPHPKKNQIREHPIRILLVEDSASDALLFIEMVEEQGKVGIDHVQTLAEAGERAASEHYDVILMDLGLPDSQGLATFNSLQTRAPSVPIIVLTSLEDEETAREAIQSGAQDYLLKKDLTNSSIKRAVYYGIERESLQEQLRQSQRMEAVGQLAGGVAHDFNNLLTVIQGNAFLLQEEAKDLPWLANGLSEILKAADRGSSLTRQLLLFSRRKAMCPVPADINTILRNLLKLLGRTLPETIKVEFQGQENISSIHADVAMLEQVFMNLIVNARDAMPSGGTISIKTFAETISTDGLRSHFKGYPGDFVCFEVRDTGSGIPVEIMPRIFEPFFTTKEVGKGTGLGLATVVGIVQQHRGWIEVETEKDQGTAFTIFLPAESFLEAPTTIIEQRPTGGSETILLVEDDPLVRGLAATILSGAGYKAVEAGTAAEAIELLKRPEQKFDLVLTDLLLPGGMSGRQLGEWIASNMLQIAILYTSGYSPDFVEPGFVLQPEKNFLAKPYSAPKLLQAVGRSLAGVRKTA